jgi:hypothetical protein
MREQAGEDIHLLMVLQSSPPRCCWGQCAVFMARVVVADLVVVLLDYLEWWLVSVGWK